MADRELVNVLVSGEIANINLGGITSDEAVQTKADVATTLVPYDARIAELEASHTLLLIASSTAATQEPSVVDTPLQIEFGAAQVTTDIDISAAGAITFKTAGKYIISPFFQYGRTGATGTSFLMNRYLRNGTQEGGSLAAKIDNANTLVPWSSSIQFTAAVNDVLTIEIVRDSGGDNSGGLFSLSPTTLAWNDAPCAAIQIYKAT